MKNLVIIGLLIVTLGGCATARVANSSSNEFTATELSHVDYLYSLNPESPLATEESVGASASVESGQS